MTDQPMQSESIAALAAALAKAQGAMGHAAKAATNPHFKSNYADLASVWDACRAPLAANGLAVSQSVSNTVDGVCITTTLMHASGEWTRDRLVIPVAQKTAQAYGSAITYGRRYTLAALVGVAADDDDGTEATTPPPGPRGAKPPPAGSRTSAIKERLKSSTQVIDVPAGATEQEAEAATKAKPPPNFSTMSTPAIALKIKDLGAWLEKHPNHKDAPAARERLYDCQIELANRKAALEEENAQAANEGAPA
jgi:hypothetical protein